MIAIIDYNMGNVGSILNMLKKIGAPGVISRERQVIEQADKLILPGVGAFDRGMKNLKDLGLIDLLQDLVVRQHRPILGICLGNQLFSQQSEEGSLLGLGWIHAQTKRFDFSGTAQSLKIPHMGWNTIEIQKNCPLFEGLKEESRFYFVHSYHVVCQDPEDIATQTFYGYNFVSSVQKDNILGVQFHPEKSHTFGIHLFRNFLTYY